MRYLTVEEILTLHQLVLDQSGGSAGLRDASRLEAAAAQPTAAFGEQDLYPTLCEKAAALGFSLIQGHPFVDGNKRVGQLAMEAFLLLNGSEINADVDDQERTILAVAAGTMNREDFASWLQAHLVRRH